MVDGANDKIRSLAAARFISSLLEYAARQGQRSGIHPSPSCGRESEQIAFFERCQSPNYLEFVRVRASRFTLHPSPHVWTEASSKLHVTHPQSPLPCPLCPVYASKSRYRIFEANVKYIPPARPPGVAGILRKHHLKTAVRGDRPAARHPDGMADRRSDGPVRPSLAPLFATEGWQ